MNNIPTAEEVAMEMFIKLPKAHLFFDRLTFTGKELKQVAIMFAQKHVQAALEQVHKDMQLPEDDLEFTLDSYPLNKIK